MTSKRLLIISENDLERTCRKTADILKESGYVLEFARGPLKIEELLLKQFPELIIWDVRFSNKKLCVDIAKLISQVEIEGIIFINSEPALFPEILSLLNCKYEITDSFERPLELLNYLSGKKPLNRHTTENSRSHTEIDNAKLAEKEFIGMFGNKNITPDNEENNSEKPPVHKQFDGWDPTGNTVKDALSTPLSSNPKGIFGKMKSIFKPSDEK